MKKNVDLSKPRKLIFTLMSVYLFLIFSEFFEVLTLFYPSGISIGEKSYKLYCTLAVGSRNFILVFQRICEFTYDHSDFQY